MLKHGLTCTERSGDETCTALADRVGRIDGTNASLKELEGTRFGFVSHDSFLYRPLLDHRHLLLIAVSVKKHGDCVTDLVLAFLNDGFDGVLAFEYERNHDLVGLMVLIDLTQPRSGFNLVADLSQRLERPELVLIKREAVLASLEEHAGQLVEVVLQAVVVTAEQTGTKRHLQHVTGELNEVTDLQTTRRFKHLNKHVVAGNLNYLCHQFHIADVNVADLVL